MNYKFNNQSIATAVDALRVKCQHNTNSEATCTVTVELEPHGTREVSLTIAPMGGGDGRWFLEVAIRGLSGAHSRQWLKTGSRDQVMELLGKPAVVEAISVAAREMADAEFHTDGLPERW
jgi:hypothetical protein